MQVLPVVGLQHRVKGVNRLRILGLSIYFRVHCFSSFFCLVEPSAWLFLLSSQPDNTAGECWRVNGG